MGLVVAEVKIFQLNLELMFAAVNTFFKTLLWRKIAFINPIVSCIRCSSAHEMTISF